MVLMDSLKKWTEIRPSSHFTPDSCTVKCRFYESQFDVKSRFKVQNLVTKMEFHMKKSLYKLKSKFKDSKYAERGHFLNQDFTVQLMSAIRDTED